MTPEKLLDILRTDTMEIIFTKKDGSLRTMFCTLNEAYLPETNSTHEPKPYTGLITVWDLENEGWRSFNYEAIQEVEWDEGINLRREILQ